MTSEPSIRSKVESIMLQAEREALKVLNPATRKIIVTLKSLYRGERSEDEILAECLLVYKSCKNLKPALKFLEELGVVTWKPWSGKYALTDFGRSVAEALMDIVKDIHELIEAGLKSNMDLVDLYVQLVTPAISMIEIAIGTRSANERLLALAIHAYISTLLAAALAQLAREDPRFQSVLSTLEKMIVEAERAGEEEQA